MIFFFCIIVTSKEPTYTVKRPIDKFSLEMNTGTFFVKDWDTEFAGALFNFRVYLLYLI